MDARFCYLILRQRNGVNAMAFGELLQEGRKRSGMTQEEFAEKMNGFTSRLDELFAESRRLEDEIKKQLGRVKYE